MYKVLVHLVYVLWSGVYGDEDKILIKNLHDSEGYHDGTRERVCRVLYVSTDTSY